MLVIADDTKTKRLKTPDAGAIMSILNRHKDAIKLFLDSCVHCTMCSASCFLQSNHPKDPSFMPSHKIIHSIGRLYRKKGKISWEELEEIRDIVWNKCVLCTRCYCVLHLEIPQMIALAREVCRSQGVVPSFDWAQQSGASCCSQASSRNHETLQASA